MKTTTKEKVLALLRENSCNYISGQELADRLFVTRAAVWKAIKSLKEEGYAIEGVNNRGYRLNLNYPPITKSSILEMLDTNYQDLEIKIFDEVSSTNDLARELALSGHKSECVVIADHQTKGRGRSAHTFYSPEGTGLYMSILLYPDIKPDHAAYITCMTAVAVQRALSTFTKDPVKIKWVNDLFFRDKKIAGILTEAGFSLEARRLSYVVVGIGINLLPPKDGFPEEIGSVAGVLFPEGNKDPGLRSRICASILQNIMYYYYNPQDHSWLSDYRAASMLIDHYVKIKDAREKEKIYAQVIGIDNDCRLMVRYEDGSCEALAAGEVSVVKY